MTSSKSLQLLLRSVWFSQLFPIRRYEHLQPECPGTSPGPEFYAQTSYVIEDIGMIKSILPCSKIFSLPASFLAWLKPQLAAKKTGLLWSSLVLTPSALDCSQVSPPYTQNISSSPSAGGCKPGLSKAHAAFANGQLYESLTINISISHNCCANLFHPF